MLFQWPFFFFWLPRYYYMLSKISRHLPADEEFDRNVRVYLWFFFLYRACQPYFVFTSFRLNNMLMKVIFCPHQLRTHNLVVKVIFLPQVSCIVQSTDPKLPPRGNRSTDNKYINMQITDQRIDSGARWRSDQSLCWCYIATTLSALSVLGVTPQLLFQQNVNQPLGKPRRLYRFMGNKNKE